MPMDADSPFADRPDADTPRETDDLDAAVAFQDAGDAGRPVDDVDDPDHEEHLRTAEEEQAGAAAGERAEQIADGEEALRDTVDASIPGAAAPLDQTLTECRCEQCHTKAKWTGPLTPEMLERTFTRGVDEASGLPNCVHCGTPMVAVNFLRVEDAISKAAEQLDAERAGDAARPMHQPSIPGILPAFDWRRAQLRTEALEESVASAESAWDDAKEVAADCKKTFDATVDALRQHIQETHRARIDAEFQHGRDSGPIAPLPDAGERAGLQGCLTERTTGKPCPICRTANAAPTDSTTRQHLAAAMAVRANAGELDAESLAAALEELLHVIVPLDSFTPWTPDDFRFVALYLEAVAGLSDDHRASTPVPLILGRPHQAGGLGGGCRVCGALLQAIADEEGFPNGFESGQLVGLDCAGDPAADAEPARAPKPRHAKTADRQKAKQAAATKDHATEQRAEGAKKTAKKKPAKASLKSAGTKKGSKKS